MNHIELISYNLQNNIESYYFAYVRPLSFLNSIDKNRTIKSIQLSASTIDKGYLDEAIAPNWQTMGDLQLFFSQNPIYEFDDLELELNNNLKINGHDDGDVNIEFPKGSEDNKLIADFYNAYNIPESIIAIAKNQKGYYLQLENSNTIVATFYTFEAYVESLKAPCKIVAAPIPFPAKHKLPTILHIDYDLYTLNVVYEVSIDNEYLVSFQHPVAFKVMDEQDLIRFWQYKIITNNALVEIKQGGMLEREKEDSFISDQIHPLREFLLKGSDESLFVLCNKLPIIKKKK
jgi:hypothetical protein